MRPCTGLTAGSLLRWRFRHAHACLDARFDRITAEQCSASIAAAVGISYAQIVLCEDLCVHGVLAAGAPLALADWSGRTGLSKLPALTAPIGWRTWARHVRLDLPALRTYARAVFAATDRSLVMPPAGPRDSACGDVRACVLTALVRTLATRRHEIDRVLAHADRPAAHETS